MNNIVQVIIDSTTAKVTTGIVTAGLTADLIYTQGIIYAISLLIFFGSISLWIYEKIK